MRLLTLALMAAAAVAQTDTIPAWAFTKAEQLGIHNDSLCEAGRDNRVRLKVQLDYKWRSVHLLHRARGGAYFGG